MFSICLRKHLEKKKKRILLTLIIKMYILFARAIITSTVPASSVCPSSYRNTILNKSSRVLSQYCFLINKLTSVLLLIMNFVMTLSKELWNHEAIAEWIRIMTKYHCQ